jgi:hypothetical protein
MSLEDLECHLVELDSKDLNRRGVLRRLIQEYCRQGKVEKALKAKEAFTAAGYEFSAGMLAMLFDLMVRVGNLDEAETSLRELNQLAPNFVLDEYKIIDYATLLILKHRTEGKNISYSLHRTKCHGQVLNTPALYSVGPRFKSWPGDRLSSLRFCSFSQSLQANARTVP